MSWVTLVLFSCALTFPFDLENCKLSIEMSGSPSDDDHVCIIRMDMAGGDETQWYCGPTWDELFPKGPQPSEKQPKPPRDDK